MDAPSRVKAQQLKKTLHKIGFKVNEAKGKDRGLCRWCGL